MTQGINDMLLYCYACVCVVCVLLEWSLPVALAVIKSNYSALSGVHLSAACTNHTPAHLSKDCKEDIQA